MKFANFLKGSPPWAPHFWEMSPLLGSLRTFWKTDFEFFNAGGEAKFPKRGGRFPKSGEGGRNFPKGGELTTLFHILHLRQCFVVSPHSWTIYITLRDAMRKSRILDVPHQALFCHQLHSANYDYAANTNTRSFTTLLVQPLSHFQSPFFRKRFLYSLIPVTFCKSC
jgi:hypothetical protein